MSKLNEEILDVLKFARAYMTDPVWVQRNQTKLDLQKRLHSIARLDLLWDYFVARRRIEECRRDEGKF